MSVNERNKYRETGGPVYPSSSSNAAYGSGGGLHITGLSLRDHIAIVAMQSMMSNKDLFERMTTEMIAIEAYEQADAMLERRNK